MFLAHSFRLRDPWQCEATEGGVRWSRVFHRPTGLEEDDELWLVVSGLPLSAQVAVNGHCPPRGRESLATIGAETNASAPVDKDSQPLPASPHEYRVTHLLRDANQVEILLPPASSLQPPASPSSFPYDARLGVVACS
jgi:hypothetical protein